MDFLTLASNRFSTRSFDIARPLTSEIMNYILEAGRLAPSACNKQPWEFLVVSSPEGLAKIRPCYPRPWFQNAPHILIIKGFKDQSWVRSDGYNSLETDLTIAMDHMILAASSQGVGTCWIEAYDPLLLAEALSLKMNERIFAITPLGYPLHDWSPSNPKTRKPLNEIVHFL